MTHTPLRQLPVTSPPAPYETIESYLNRLERLNHLQREELTRIIATTRTPRLTRRRLTAKEIDVQGLSVMAGYPATTLRRAMPQLHRPDWRLFQHDPRSACRQCVQRRGGPVTCFYRSYSLICLKHQTWVGGHPLGHPTRDRSLSISQLPDVLAAQRRHHRLVNRHGQHAVAYALRTAQDCVDYWTEHTAIHGIQGERLDVLLSPGWEKVSYQDPAYLASYYPELVAITATFVSPRWRAMAADPHTREAFFSELRRQTRGIGYRRRRRDPLDDWIADLVHPHNSTDIRFPEPTARTTDQ